jgi:poly(A)-specific ribonuclease
MEALMGFDFAETLPVEYLIDNRVADREAAINRTTEHLKNLQSELTREQPILVGHNSLYDLCFIYHSFCGPLPPTIQQFGVEMHYLFPRIVDTKYLARRPGNHSMLADDNLSELFQSACQLDMPKIIRDPDMSEVVRGDYQVPGIAAHQAGYDSKF